VFRHDWAGTVEVECADAMDFAPAGFREAYCDGFLKLVRHSPDMWAWMYNLFDRKPLDSKTQRVRRALERLGTRAIVKRVLALRPGRVVCTHFLPAELLSGRRVAGALGAPLSVVITDFVVHTMWVHPGVDRYFVAAEELVPSLIGRGVPAERITASGIPVMPAFSQPPPRALAARELGLSPDVPTVLLLSGGFGVSDLSGIAERILRLPGQFQVVACAGRNQGLLQQLVALSQTDLANRGGRRLVPQPYTTTIERVMAAADIAVTKPGGLTTSECLAMGLPMLVNSPIPGQEDRNCDYLLENGAAWKAQDVESLAFKLQRLLSDPAARKTMADSARKLARPNAARQVAAAVLNT
jgi:processive 1,2-diacylglycerol beta-glucosyltransferase